MNCSLLVLNLAPILPIVVVYASLRRVEKSKFWHVAFCDETGKRTLRSTKESNRKRALIKAEAMEKLAGESRRRDTDRKFLMQIVEVGLRQLGHSVSEPSGREFLTLVL